MNTYTIHWWILDIIGLIGLYLFSGAVHETIHYFDFKNLEGVKDNVCLNSLPLNFSSEFGKAGGYNDLTYANGSIYQETQPTIQKSEIKAYIVQILIIALGFYSFSKLNFRMWELELENKIFREELYESSN